jgi:hypothetical protein
MLYYILIVLVLSDEGKWEPTYQKRVYGSERSCAQLAESTGKVLERSPVWQSRNWVVGCKGPYHEL